MTNYIHKKRKDSLETRIKKINLHTTRIPFERDSSYTCQLSTKVLAPSRLVSQVWAKCKDKVSMCQVPTKISNSGKQNFQKKDDCT